MLYNMYLWLDLWDRRCWIAVYFHGVVFPKAIIDRHNVVKELKKYIWEYDIQYIIIGLPYDLYGKNLRQLEKTQWFINKLKTILPEVEVIGMDERFTSFEADISLKSMWIKNTIGQKDDISAAIILESYLKQNNI